MAYMGRKTSATSIYHVMARGINREKIFKQERESQYFLKILKQQLEKYEEIEIYAYCVMPTHMHILIKSEIQILSSFMAIVLAEYAEYYNYKHKRNGHVFQGRFKSECVENISYFWSCVRYIHNNPVKSKIVEQADQYEFSSIKAYLKQKSQIIHENALKMCERDFSDMLEFQRFHLKNQQFVFVDIYPELYMQELDLATQILLEMKEENKFERLSEVLENKYLREKHLEKLRNTLQISKRESQKIYLDIKKKVL